MIKPVLDSFAVPELARLDIPFDTSVLASQATVAMPASFCLSLVAVLRPTNTGIDAFVGHDYGCSSIAVVAGFDLSAFDDRPTPELAEVATALANDLHLAIQSPVMLILYDPVAREFQLSTATKRWSITTAAAVAIDMFHVSSWIADRDIAARVKALNQPLPNETPQNLQMLYATWCAWISQL
jgi:hypothetical protein